MYKFIILLTALTLGCMAKQTDEERLTYLVSTTGNRLAAQYNLHLFGFGIEGPGRIKGYILQFLTAQKVDIDQARNLLIRVVEELKQLIKGGIQNENLDWNPDDPNFLYISITFEDEDGGYVISDKFLTLVSLSKDVVKFNTFDKSTRSFIPITSETYQEAYQKVFGTPQ